MNNRLDPDTDLNGATGEGMTHEALSQSDEELKLLRHDEDYGDVFKEEWESEYGEQQDEGEEDGSGNPDVTITTDKEELIKAVKQKEEDEKPSDEWVEAEQERKAAEVGKSGEEEGDEELEEEQTVGPKKQAGKDQKEKKKESG